MRATEGSVILICALARVLSVDATTLLRKAHSPGQLNVSFASSNFSIPNDLWSQNEQNAEWWPRIAQSFKIAHRVRHGTRILPNLTLLLRKVWVKNPRLPALPCYPGKPRNYFGRGGKNFGKSIFFTGTRPHMQRPISTWVKVRSDPETGRPSNGLLPD